MSTSTDILVQNDGFLEILAEAIAADQGAIQGFLYADHHVIRDLNKPWAEQEIWRRRQAKSDDYDACHAAMMRQIEIEKLRRAVERALAMVQRPFPHQEKAAAKARSALAQQAKGEGEGGGDD